MFENSLRPVWRRIKSIVRPPLHKPVVRLQYDLLGSEYGRWPVLRNSLDQQSRVYSFGVGEDISFDLELIERFGVSVEAFDPTPRCRAWLAKQSLPKNFCFHDVGLSNKVGMLCFSAPEMPDHVSYTTGRRANNTEVVELPVQPLSACMAQLGDNQIDLLKIDIEGSEYDVIADMLENRIYPGQFCVEFHHAMFNYTRDDTISAVKRLSDAGYLLYYVSSTHREYAFVHQRALVV